MTPLLIVILGPTAVGKTDLTLSLAKHFKISREHLSRIFCAETGMPLHEYVIRFRLRLAIDLLRHSQLSLKEISLRCGWKDYSSFYRIFFKRFKRSPQAFRNGLN